MPDRPTFSAAATVIAALFAGAVLPAPVEAADGASGSLGNLTGSAARVVTLAEVEAAARRRFAALDTDGDGKLAPHDLTGVLSAQTFAAADVDGDGSLDTSDYLDLVSKHFHSADADRDGMLDARELSSPAGARLVALVDV